MAILVAGVMLAGCGGDDEPPTIPATLGEELAQDAGAIAETLDSGDECAARREARALRAQVRAAGEEGRIDPELRDPLVASIDGLVGRIPCDEEPPAAQPPRGAQPAPIPGTEPVDCDTLEDELERLEDRAKAEDERLKEREDAAKERAGDDKDAKDAAKERFKEDREARRERFDAQKQAFEQRIDACEEGED